MNVRENFMDNITIKDILTTYWSQTTLILIAVGFIIRSYTDLKVKKTEINHNLFQEKKMESVNRFFSNTATTIQMWKDLPILQILENQFTAKEIDKLIFPNLNELRRNVLELKIYFDKKEHIQYQRIIELMHEINSKLSSTYFSYDKEISTIVKSNNFQDLRDNKLEEINKVLEIITEKIRKDFK